MNKEQNGRAPVERRVMRPGRGWKYLAGPVWEHVTGTRVHIGGFVKLPNGTFLSANKWPDSMEVDMMIRINGGSRKRGLMSWAMTHNAKLTGRVLEDVNNEHRL